jgi:proline dehydrogenase
LKYNKKFRKGIRVRTCKGIYIESRKISTRSKSKIRRRLIERIKHLFRGGFYVEIATHDHKVIYKIIEYIEENNFKNDCFEFQFLKGVQKGYEIEGTLRERGYKVRYYMPVELKKYEGVSYMTRRCIENPQLIMDFLKNKYRKYRADRKLQA